jgi:multidrug efflux pump subunit AcrA (membrane-fusion protein)
VDLETTRYELAEKGARVRVEMPDGNEVAGTIARVGRVAERKPASAEDTDPPATVELTIRLKRGSGLALDQAPVDVELEKKRARDVLTIPVTALLARQGGSFAVEVREGDRRRIVPVETGLYTDGDVEISGAGLRPGMTITDARV